MFSLRQAAVRVLTTRSSSIAIRPRTISSFTPVSVAKSRIIAPTQFQRRWATNEAEARKGEEEVPVSQIQPTPQEEVENALHQDQGTATATGNAESSTPIAETANATEATEEATSTAAESQSVHEAVDAPKPAKSAASAFAGLSAGLTGSEKGTKSFREPAEPKETIYVGNLFFDVTENDLSKEFARFGNVQQSRLIRDARGLSKGFGYITFESTEQAQQAVAEMNQQLFEGRRLIVSYAHTNNKPSGDREHRPVNPPSKTLFIGNMSFEMTDRDLNDLFRGIRNVIDVRVAIDRRTGQPRGFAHADFIDVKSAQEAMKVLAGKENYGRKLRVDYSYGPQTAPRNTPR